MSVLNKHKHQIPSDAVYIGRGSRWGNPFVIGKHGSRDEVIAKYRSALDRDIKNGKVSLKDLAALHGKDLVCFCKPLPCHGDVLERAAAWAVTELNKQASL